MVLKFHLCKNVFVYTKGPIDFFLQISFGPIKLRSYELRLVSWSVSPYVKPITAITKDLQLRIFYDF